jgi:predicted metal-binding membrane protein
MSLLFVVGVMNPGWIAVLALITLVEKTRPPNWSINRWIGGAAISAGIAIFVVAALPLTI